MRIARHATQHAAITILLAIALLFAQWSGLQHRVEHADIEHDHAASMFAADEEHDQDGRHSCASFDAAAVADAIHIPPLAAPLPASAQMLASWAAFVSWDAPLVRHFSPRAPPLA